jgi:hypothetical protein
MSHMSRFACFMKPESSYSGIGQVIIYRRFCADHVDLAFLNGSEFTSSNCALRVLRVRLAPFPPSAAFTSFIASRFDVSTCELSYLLFYRSSEFFLPISIIVDILKRSAPRRCNVFSSSRRTAVISANDLLPSIYLLRISTKTYYHARVVI